MIGQHVGGQSVFSQSAIHESWWQGMKGGLQGSSIVSTEELDSKIQSFSTGPHPEWVDDYLQKKGRRDWE